MKLVLIIILLLQINSIKAKQESVYFIGHSLVGNEIPFILNKLVESSKDNDIIIGRQVINGSPLKWNWEKPETSPTGNYQEDLAKGNFTILMITEAIPLQNHLTWSDTYKYANNFMEYANQYSPGISFYVYETWHCIKSGKESGCPHDSNNDPWRQRLDNDLSKWESITDSVKNNFPNNSISLLPGGQAMAMLYDEIEKGNVPSGITDIQEFFSDDIHPNTIGNYYLACLAYSAIYKESPVGLENEINNEWGHPMNTPDIELAIFLQNLAWEVFNSYYEGSINSIYNNVEQIPRSNFITTNQLLNILAQNYSYKVSLHDINGSIVYFDKKNFRDVIDNLSVGYYFILVEGTKGSKFYQLIMSY